LLDDNFEVIFGKIKFGEYEEEVMNEAESRVFE